MVIVSSWTKVVARRGIVYPVCMDGWERGPFTHDTLARVKRPGKRCNFFLQITIYLQTAKLSSERIVQSVRIDKKKTDDHVVHRFHRVQLANQYK